MTETPALLDTDTLSLLSRGQPKATARAGDYLRDHGRLTISVVSVFERLRGYKAALAAGKPFEEHLAAFEAFAASCVVLSVDSSVADVAATIWAGLTTRRRRAVGDILIAATASARGLVLVTKNRRDFEPITKRVPLELVDWSR